MPSDAPSREAKKKKTADSYLPDIHRLLPASADAEQGVLCSFLLAPAEVGNACVERRFTSEMFHIPAHQDIFSCLMSMHLEREPIDVITLTQTLRDWGKLDLCGGAAFVSQLFTFLPTAANFTYYAEIIEEKHTLREIIKIGTEYAARAYDEQAEVTTLLDEFEARAVAIAKIRHIRRVEVKELIFKVLGNLEAMWERKGEIGGISTGFSRLDQICDGLYPEEFYVFAARPGHGKTAFMLNLVDHIAIELKKPVAVFSLEMNAEQLVQRLLCSRARVDWMRVRDGQVSERDFPALTSAAAKIAESKIYIEDDAGLSIQEMRAIARRLKTEKQIGAVFIDYLQLANSTSKKAKDNRQVEVAEISRGCKIMSRELGIPVIALAQVDRGVEKGQKNPRKQRLSDLKESGAIEQDADLVGFLRLEELYAETEEEMKEAEGKATLDIQKQRRGPLGEVPLIYLKQYTRFETRAFAHEEDTAQGTLGV